MPANSNAPPTGRPATGKTASTARKSRETTATLNWVLMFSILLIVVGTVAIAFPVVTTLATTIWVGWLLLFSGSIVVTQAMLGKGGSGFAGSLFIGLFYMAGGLWVVFDPAAATVSLTILIAVVFLAEGILETLFAFRMQPARGWGWMLVSGITAIAAGAMIAYALPSSATWAVGLLVGINLISTGVSFAVLSLAASQVVLPR